MAWCGHDFTAHMLRVYVWSAAMHHRRRRVDDDKLSNCNTTTFRKYICSRFSAQSACRSINKYVSICRRQKDQQQTKTGWERGRQLKPLRECSSTERKLDKQCERAVKISAPEPEEKWWSTVHTSQAHGMCHIRSLARHWCWRDDITVISSSILDSWLHRVNIYSAVGEQRGMKKKNTNSIYSNDCDTLCARSILYRVKAGRTNSEERTILKCIDQ